MPATREDLMAALARLGIATTTIDHPPVFTVEEARSLRGTVPGAHTKNLFLKDKKDRLYLVVAPEDAELDLKQLHHRVGASGRFTAFAPINDTAGRVTVVLDASLAAAEVVNCHPLVNTATTTIAARDLLAFLRSTGHEPLIVALTGEL